jgi:hypothetical protein
MPNSNDLTTYKQAVWDFILEHSDITRGGAIFVKFHTSNRADFERRVYGRIKGYHREDPGMKEEIQLPKQQVFQATKKYKRTCYMLEKTERQKRVEIVAKRNRRWAFWRRIGLWFAI